MKNLPTYEEFINESYLNEAKIDNDPNLPNLDVWYKYLYPEDKIKTNPWHWMPDLTGTHPKSIAKMSDEDFGERTSQQADLKNADIYNKIYAWINTNVSDWQPVTRAFPKMKSFADENKTDWHEVMYSKKWNVFKDEYWVANAQNNDEDLTFFAPIKALKEIMKNIK